MNIKNNQKGFVAQAIVLTIAIIIIAAVAYYAGTKNVVAPKGGDVVVNATTTQNTQPTISVLSPNGGESWKIGQTYKVLFGMGGDLGMKTVRLNRYSDDGVRVGFITIGTTNTDNLSFKIPVGTEETKGMASRYKIQVIVDKYADGRGVSDESDNYFSITSATLNQPSLTVLSPNGNENWVKGTTKTILWSNPPTQTVSGVGAPQDEIAIFINSQPTDTAPLAKTIVTGLSKNATSYDWTVGSAQESSLIVNGSYYIKVCRKSFTCDWSDTPFTITN